MKIVFTVLTCTLFRNCKRKLKSLLKISQLTCCVSQLTILWFVYSKYMRSKYLILNTCSHENQILLGLPQQGGWDGRDM